MQKQLFVTVLVVVLLLVLIPLQSFAINLQAIDLARNSTQFQSVMNGYGYSYMSSGSVSANNTNSILLAFLPFNNTHFIGKVIEVTENEKATVVTGVYVNPAISHGSFAPPPPLINQTKYVWNIPSPLLQLQQAIGFKDIVCSYDFVELTKIGSLYEYPICVKPHTSWKLLERGWELVNHTYPNPES